MITIWVATLMKTLSLWQYAEVYSEPTRKSTIELFTEIVDGFQPLTTRFFYKQRLFQPSLSVAYLFHELSFKYCLGIA